MLGARAMSVLPEGAFGERVRARLRDEQIIWLVTVGADGTPQPNPVWFLWDDERDPGTLLIYSAHDAHRLAHIAARPGIAAHFDGDRAGNDVVVLVGTARRVDDVAAPDRNEVYLAKYGAAMIEVSGSVESFAAIYSAALRIDVARIRGF